MLFPVIDIPETNMTSTSNSTLNYMNLGVLRRNQLKQMSQRVDSTTTELFQEKSWRNIYTWRQWELHIDNLSVEELQRDHAALTKKARELWQQKKEKHRLFHSSNMKSWRNVYTRRQWELHIDNLYEAMPRVAKRAANNVRVPPLAEGAVGRSGPLFA